MKAEYSERIAAVTRKSTSNEDDEEEGKLSVSHMVGVL